MSSGTYERRSAFAEVADVGKFGGGVDGRITFALPETTLDNRYSTSHQFPFFFMQIICWCDLPNDPVPVADNGPLLLELA